MKKQIISMLLVLALTLSVFSLGAVSTTAADSTAAITVGGQTHTVKVGDFVEYSIAFTYSGNNISTAQVELPVDFTALSGYSRDEIATHLMRIAPTTSDSAVVKRFEGNNTLGNMTGYVMNFVKVSGYSFTTKKVVLSLIFGVEKAGNYNLSAKV